MATSYQINDARKDLDADATTNINEHKQGNDPSEAGTVVENRSLNVIDDGQAGTSSRGSWLKSGGVNPNGSKSLYSKEAGATYSYQSSISGSYDLELWWTQYASRCTDVPVQIYNGSKLLETVTVNQQKNGGRWNYIGPYDFTGQARVVVKSKGTCSTSADAVTFSKADHVVSNVVVDQAPNVIDDG